MATPAADLAASIDTAIATLTLGTNLFANEMKVPGNGVPQLAVFCLASGGEPPTGYLNGNAAPRLYQPLVEIRVRCSPHDFTAGQALAVAIRTAIHNSPPAGYIDCQVRESHPVFVAEMDNGSHVWQLNALLMYEE